MNIDYRINAQITATDFIDLLKRSTLGQRRPIHDMRCIEGMVKNTNLCVTAWHGDVLIGVARSVTDFHYACYLSDLAVDVAYQRVGIGREMIHRTQAALGPRCTIRLISAPGAVDYYPKIGFSRNEQCWELKQAAMPTVE